MIPDFVLLAIIFLLFFFYWYRRPQNFPPGPRGLPIVGVLPFLGKYPERTIKKWSEKYGPIMSVRMGLKDMVVLNDYDVIQQAFVKQGTQFSGRPYSKFMEQMHGGEYGLASLNYGEMWKEQRTFGLSTLRRFGFGKHSMESKILDEISYLIPAIQEHQEKPFDISFLIHSAVSNVICKITLGKRYDYNDPEFKSLYKFVKNQDDPMLNLMTSLFQLAPILMKLPILSGYDKKLADGVELAKNVIAKIIEKHKESLDEEDIRDFVDAFLVEAERNPCDSYSIKQLTGYIVDIFFAGTETTSSFLYWSLLCLLHYPEAQNRLRKEIMDVVGSDGTITMQIRSKMPYTCAFTEEVLRFRTLGPMSVAHATTEDAVLENYTIPKGTIVSENLWAVHNDKNIWKKPEQFNPDRFLNDKGEFVKSPHVIPFSVGPRYCLGKSLAQMEIFFFVVSLVRAFEFLPDTDANILSSIEDGVNGFLFVPNSYKLVAREI